MDSDEETALAVVPLVLVLKIENTRFRDAIPASIKLAITIKFLATGMSYSELAYQFKYINQR